MLSRSKVFLYLAALLSACCFTSKTDAVGISYDFTAETNFSGWDVIAYGDGVFHLDSPGFEFDPTESFRSVNQTVSGQFSYDTDAPVAYEASNATWDYKSYEAEAFSIDLSNDLEETLRFDVPSPRVSRSNYTDPVRRYFTMNGWQGVDPPVTLTGDGGCDEEFCETEFFSSIPIGQLREKRPDLFNNVDHVEVVVYGFDPSSTLNLSSVNTGLRADSMSADPSLPVSLPTLGGDNYGWMNIDFSPEGGQFLGMEAIGYGFITEPFEGQVEQIEQYISGFHVEIEANVHYNLTELTQLPIGTTPHNPILPDDPDGEPGGGFDFTFDTPEDGEFTFIDPDVAVGYDYEVLTGPNFSAVLLPDDIGDGLYDLWLFDDGLGVFVDAMIEITGGVPYMFGPSGVDKFRILGIETSEMLDPTDPLAFVTGLQFQIGGGTTIEISQTPITEYVVPEPAGAVLLLSTFAGLLLRQRKVA